MEIGQLLTMVKEQAYVKHLETPKKYRELINTNE